MNKISLVRHWEAKYANTEHSNSFDSEDIKEESLSKLKEQAKVFTSWINKNENVTIWSSPIPRALQTAKIFIDELESNWIKIRTKKIFKVFEEVRWFRWEYLKTMVDWWKILIWWEEYYVDKQITNPLWLNYSTYFRQSSHKDISDDNLKLLWKFWEIIKNIESYSSVLKRVFREFERLSKKENIGHILIFTHQCNTDFIVELLNWYKNWGILPWESITLKQSNWDYEVVAFPQDSAETTWQIISKSKEKYKDILW